MFTLSEKILEKTCNDISENQATILGGFKKTQ